MWSLTLMHPREILLFLAHVLFTCPFARGCWPVAGVTEGALLAVWHISINSTPHAAEAKRVDWEHGWLEIQQARWKW